MGRGDNSLVPKSRSHDQDGCNDHIWKSCLMQTSNGVNEGK